ncbi:hypothetical protein STPL106120_10940 [Streptococcus pluranimalium]
MVSVKSTISSMVQGLPTTKAIIKTITMVWILCSKPFKIQHLPKVSHLLILSISMLSTVTVATLMAIVTVWKNSMLACQKSQSSWGTRICFSSQQTTAMTQPMQEQTIPVSTSHSWLTAHPLQVVVLFHKDISLISQQPLRTTLVLTPP